MIFQIIYMILILGFILFSLLAFYTYKRLGRGWSPKVLLKDFNRKMWMTIFLGSSFFGLYLLIVLLSGYLIRPWSTDLFFMVYHHPVKFIYLGLWLFVCTSMGIYLMRMVIKYFYLTRGKDR